MVGTDNMRRVVEATGAENAVTPRPVGSESVGSEDLLTPSFDGNQERIPVDESDETEQDLVKRKAQSLRRDFETRLHDSIIKFVRAESEAFEQTLRANGLAPPLPIMKGGLPWRDSNVGVYNGDQDLLFKYVGVRFDELAKEPTSDELTESEMLDPMRNVNMKRGSKKDKEELEKGEDGPKPISKEKVTRKSILQFPSGTVEIGFPEDEGSMENGKSPKTEIIRNVVQTLAAEPPKLPYITTVDPKGFINLLWEYEEYERKCRAVSMIPKTIDHCFKEETRLCFVLGWLGKDPEDTEITSRDVWSAIEEAKRTYPEGKAGMVLSELPEVIKNKWDLTLDGVKARASSLWSAMKYHLYLHRCSHYLTKPAPGMSDDTKLKRQKIVSILVSALKPEDFRKSIERIVQDDPTYKYDTDALFNLVLSEGEKFEYVFRARLANKATHSKTEDEKNAGRREKKSYQAKKADTEAKMVTFKKATCIGCHKKGHFFLAKDKTTDKWMKNCPETYPKEKFIALKEESLKIIKESENRRKSAQSKTNTSDKKDMKKTSGAKKISVEELADTVAGVVKEMNNLITAAKAEKAEDAKAEKEREENRYKLLSMSD